MREEQPDGWVCTTLGSLLREPLRNGHSARASTDGTGVRTLTLSAVTYGDFSEGNTKLTIADPAKVGDLWLEPGDLLIERSNTPELVGTSRLYKGARNFAIFPDLVIRARLLSAALPAFIELALHLAETRKYFIENAQGTAGSMPKIDQGIVKRLPLLLPPLPEQRRIVEKVEALLAHVSAARICLAKVAGILKRFRQAVLRAACSGSLTTDWRETRPRPAHHAQLLATLREARLAAWEEEETPRLRAQRKYADGKDLRARYRAPIQAEPAFPVPEGWTWASLDELTLLMGGITKGQKRTTGTRTRRVPYLRVANVQRGYLDLGEVKEIEATEKEISELRLRPGDILLNEGGDIDKLGRGWTWNGEIQECIHQNHVFRARPASDLIDPRFVSHHANTFGQEFFFQAGAQTVNLASLSMTKLKALPVPVPPIEEQREILRRVESLLAIENVIQQRVSASSTRIDMMTQVVLARAFRGDLVPTEAELARQEGREYEPASTLLERIRSSRTGDSSATMKRRRGGRGNGTPPRGPLHRFQGELHGP